MGRIDISQGCHIRWNRGKEEEPRTTIYMDDKVGSACVVNRDQKVADTKMQYLNNTTTINVAEM